MLSWLHRILRSKSGGSTWRSVSASQCIPCGSNYGRQAGLHPEK